MFCTPRPSLETSSCPNFLRAVNRPLCDWACAVVCPSRPELPIATPDAVATVALKKLRLCAFTLSWVITNSWLKILWLQRAGARWTYPLAHVPLDTCSSCKSCLFGCQGGSLCIVRKNVALHCELLHHGAHLLCIRVLACVALL